MALDATETANTNVAFPARGEGQPRAPAHWKLWTALRTLALLSAVSLAGYAHARTICNNATGSDSGYFYTLFRDTGSGCITLGSQGNYRTTWDLGSSGNLVAGEGWSSGSTSRVVAYVADAFNPGANGYLSLYGWSTDPLVEYYIVDSWGDFRPPGDAATYLGTMTSDGGVYQIYRTQRVNQPSIVGVATFYQYWSVRTSKRLLGGENLITFANHVKAWRTAGLNLGTMNYQILATEGYGSRGSSNVRVWQH